MVILKLKNKFHQHKSLISMNNIDINKIVLSNKVCFGKKGFEYFICDKNGKNIRPSCILLPKMSAYKIYFYETKYMTF